MSPNAVPPPISAPKSTHQICRLVNNACNLAAPRSPSRRQHARRRKLPSRACSASPTRAEDSRRHRHPAHHPLPPTPFEGRQTGAPEKTKPSFCSPAQTRMGVSAPPALVTTIAYTANAMDTSYGMAHPGTPENAISEELWAQTAPSASTGSYPEAVVPPPTPQFMSKICPGVISSEGGRRNS